MTFRSVAARLALIASPCGPSSVGRACRSRVERLKARAGLTPCRDGRPVRVHPYLETRGPIAAERRRTARERCRGRS